MIKDAERLALERAAEDRHGTIADVRYVSRDGLIMLANSPAPGMFWPGCTADESEMLNNQYYSRERAENVSRLLRSLSRGDKRAKKDTP